VGGVSAALMASSPFVELKVPATMRPMVLVSLSKPSAKSHSEVGGGFSRVVEPVRPEISA
jgi:hypothetical protein